MDAAETGEIRFGPFRLSVRQRVLANAAGPVKISSRAFDLLVALIDAGDEAISKEALMRRVWSSVVVEENNLHVQIAAVRRALGQHQHYIITIPGRGYKFVASSELPEPEPAPANAAAGIARFQAVDAPTNLPARVTTMIGRTREFDSICATLAQARLVTLVGPGGVGKTTLALAVGRAEAGRFAGGCWIIEIGLVSDAALVLSAIAASLKVEELKGKSLLENIVIGLHQRPALLLFDGCEHVLEAVADIAGQLLQRCPGLRIICSSQAPLGIAGEHVRRIAPFDVPDAAASPTLDEALQFDAIRLFTERATAADDRFALTEVTMPGVIAICRSLDGMPLAIEIAAARVSLLGLEPVRLRIASRIALLKDDPAAKSDRHRMLWAAIEWSYGLLSAVDREVLRSLSVFAGGFTLSAAQEVAAGSGLAEPDILRSIGNLVRRSLLTTGPELLPRHRMLGAMREFAGEALSAANEQAATARRHAEYFRNLAAQAEAVWETRHAGAWIAPLIAEFENFRAALSWAFGPQGDAVLGVRLAAAAARIWFEDGHLTEGRAWLTRAIEHAPAGIDPATMMRLQCGLADLSVDPAAGVAAARQAVALAAAGGEPMDQGVCLRMLASSLYGLGEYDEAEQAASRAYDLLRGTGRDRTFAKCLSDLCVLHAIGGRHRESRRFNRQAQARLTALGDDRGAAICMQYAAELEFIGGDVSAALERAQTSLVLLRTINSRYQLGVGLANLAAYRLAADDAPGAAAAAGEALVIAREIEDALGAIIALEHIALALASLGAAQTAARLHGHVEAAYNQMGLKRQETEQKMHDRLVSALEAALPPDQRSSLIVEGELLEIEAATALALREPLGAV